MSLVACPFCRELYSRDEADVCPHCDLRVVPLESLGPSAEALLEMPEPEPGDRALPWLSPAAGRGPAWVGAACGLAGFFLPWFGLTHPNEVQLSGFDLARGNAPWLWGGAIGFFLLLPLVVSRRSPNDLRGIRVIAATFGIMTACEAFVLALKPPLESGYFRSELVTLPGFYLSGAVSLLTALACTRLGKLPAPKPARPEQPVGPQGGGPRAPQQSADGAQRTLH